MKIYVASSWRNSYHPIIVDLLRSFDHSVYDYRTESGFQWSQIDEHWKQWSLRQYKKALEHELAKAGFDRDLKAMQWADACVLVLPCGRSAHVEAGWMKGAGKKVFVFSPQDDEPELMYKLFDGILTVDDFRQIFGGIAI